MRTSAAGIAAIKKHEGLRLDAYPDPGSGGEPWTIGYGHTGGVRKGQTITQAQADVFLAADVTRFEKVVAKLCPITTQGQFDALVSFAFNLGEDSLRESTLRRKHNDGDYAGAADEFGRWVNASGRKMPGLVARRADERALYLSDTPKKEPAVTQLSKHFTLAEFTRSQTAARKGIDNTPPAAAIEAMKLLCEKVLEPVRSHFGKPLVLSSGYRSAALSKAVGSKPTSQHGKGEAADFEIPGVSNYEVAKWMEKNLNYDQLILEMYHPGQPNSGWIHVSYSRSQMRNQELTYDGKSYEPGLIA